MEIKQNKTNMKTLIAIVVGLIVTLVFTFFLGMGGNLLGTVHKEFSAESSLKKYEWFINQKNAIEQKSKQIEVFERELDNLLEDSKNLKDPVQIGMKQERINFVTDNLNATRNMYNDLVAEYNAQSSKFNWKPFETTDGNSIPQHYPTF